jgi:hypothetical protein
MNAIKKIVKTEGNELHLVLPDEFKDKEVDIEVSLHKVEEENAPKKEFNLEEYRQSILDYWKDINADLSNYKFNRDELYDRDDKR